MEETCSECGKTISRRAQAHVWRMRRVVCTGCRHALEYVQEPATEPQLRYAKDLGIPIPPNAAKVQMIDLINVAVEAAEREKKRKWIACWVFSVCRQMTKANWVLHSDCPVPSEIIDDLVDVILADTRLADQIFDSQDGIWNDRYNDELERRGLPYGDDWFFFNSEMGPRTRSKRYKRTVELIQERIHFI